MTGLGIRDTRSGAWVLIDCGEATQHQLLKCPLSLLNLQAICITHVHGDHCYGLPGVLASASMCGRKSPLTIVAPYGIQEMIQALMQYTDMHMSYELQFVASESLVDNPLTKVYQLDCIELSHRVPSYAYRFQDTFVSENLNSEKLLSDGLPRGALWGQLKQQGLVEYDGKTFHKDEYLHQSNEPTRVIVAGDNDRPDLLLQACKHVDLLVHEATYTQDIADKVGPGPMHSSALQVAQMAKQANLKNLILTHFSARYRSKVLEGEVSSGLRSIDDIRQEAQSLYEGNLFLANDFDVFSLDQNKTLHWVKRYGQ